MTLWYLVGSQLFQHIFFIQTLFPFSWSPGYPVAARDRQPGKTHPPRHSGHPGHPIAPWFTWTLWSKGLHYIHPQPANRIGNYRGISYLNIWCINWQMFNSLNGAAHWINATIKYFADKLLKLKLALKDNERSPKHHFFFIIGYSYICINCVFDVTEEKKLTSNHRCVIIKHQASKHGSERSREPMYSLPWGAQELVSHCLGM